jgi:hypothetical protein
MEQLVAATAHRAPWNKGKLVGQKVPFKLREIWRSAFAFSYMAASAILHCST